MNDTTKAIVCCTVLTSLICFLLHQHLYITRKTNATNDELKKRLPQAIVIGAKKGGTHALRFMLDKHPDIKFCEREIHFFDRHYEEGLEWYRQKMPSTYYNQITMESSPAYFITETTPQRIYQMNSAILIILTVRDPIRRFISDYWHVKRQRTLPISLESVIGKPENKERLLYLLSPSLYHHHYVKWLKYFNSTQIHIVDGDNLINNPSIELERLEAFLGLKSFFQRKLFIFDKKKGYYCYRRPTEEKDCLGKSKGHHHRDVTQESKNILKALLSEDVHLFAKDAQKVFKWMKDY